MVVSGRRGGVAPRPRVILILCTSQRLQVGTYALEPTGVVFADASRAGADAERVTLSEKLASIDK